MGLLDQLNEVLIQQPRKYWGDKATRLGSLLGDAASTGAQAYGSANSPMAPEHANTLAGLLADFTPVVGDVKSAYDGMQSAREGDYLGAALGGLGALPLVPNLAGMFIGKGAKTWDAVNASRAMEMEQAGIDPRKIWSETGNWKGPDGHWRQEIPDNAAQLNLVSNGRSGEVSAHGNLSGGLSHEQLFSSYPDIGKTQASIYEGKSLPLSGSFSNDGPSYHEFFPQIMASGPNSEKAKSALIHELQHKIQSKEGFARGGSPVESRDARTGAYSVSNDDMNNYLRLAGEAEARVTQARMNMDAAKRRATFPADSYDVPLPDLIFRR